MSERGEPKRAYSDLVDIHCHILPGVDDGPPDDTTVIEMLRLAADDGVTTIVATPHARYATPERVARGVQHVNSLARAQQLAIQILPGLEARFQADLADKWQAGELVALAGGTYVLVEFSYRSEWPPLLTTSIYAMQLAGMLPIIAHAERYPVVQADPASLAPLVEMGVPVQVNAEALLGRMGSEIQQTAERLVRARLVHVIASDGHDPVKRPPQLSAALARVSELVGPQEARRMTSAAERIISGAPLVLPEPDLEALRLKRRFRLPWRHGD